MDESQKGENGAQGEQAKGKAKAKAPLADRLDKLRRRLGPLPPEEKQMLVDEFRTRDIAWRIEHRPYTVWGPHKHSLQDALAERTWREQADLALFAGYMHVHRLREAGNPEYEHHCRAFENLAAYLRPHAKKRPAPSSTKRKMLKPRMARSRPRRGDARRQRERERERASAFASQR